MKLQEVTYTSQSKDTLKHVFNRVEELRSELQRGVHDENEEKKLFYLTGKSQLLRSDSGHVERVLAELTKAYGEPEIHREPEVHPDDRPLVGEYPRGTKWHNMEWLFKVGTVKNPQYPRASEIFVQVFYVTDDTNELLRRSDDTTMSPDEHLIRPTDTLEVHVGSWPHI